MRVIAPWAGRLVAGLLLASAMTLGVGVGAAHADPIPAPTAPASPSTPTPLGTPSPAPGPAVTTPPPTTAAEDDPAWYDVPGQIRKGVTDLLSWVATTGLRPVMEALGTTILATPDMTNNPKVDAVRTTFLIIANTCFVLFVVFAGYILVTRETLHNRYGFKELMPRLVIGFAAANLSGLLCSLMITAANAVTAAIVGPGVDGPAAATAIGQALTGGIQTGGANTNGFLLALLVIAALVMALVVVITWFVRIAMLLLLVGVAPAALACHGLPQTEGLAYAWWRSMIAVLGIQVAQAAVLLATVKVFLTPDGAVINGMPATTSGLLGVCMAISMLWLMIKIPGWMKHFVMGPLRGKGAIAQVIQTVAAIKTLGVSKAFQGRPAPARPSGRPAAPPSATPTATPARPASMPVPAAVRVPARGQAQTQFSHAPVTQVPLAAPAGSTAAVFSAPQSTDQPIARNPLGYRGQPLFTSAQPPDVARRAPAGPPPRVAFTSPAAPSSAVTRPMVAASRPAPAPVFSNPAPAHSAPKRPPAPVTPVFSDAPKPRPKPAPRSSGKKKS